MSDQYRIRNHQAIHFVTFTVVDWVDIFTREVYKQHIIQSFIYCQQHKGLIIHAYCVMSNHVHLIASAQEQELLPDIIRDFKKFTNKRIVETIIEEPESRRDWMLYRFRYHAKFNNRIKDYKVWQDGYHAIECFDLKVLEQKLEYIHQNPVRAGIVSDPEHYLYSSASVYAGQKGILQINILDVGFAGIGNSIG